MILKGLRLYCKHMASIVDIFEMSFGAVIFNLGPRSKVKKAILTNISKSLRDGETFHIVEV